MESFDDTVAMDAATRRNLELTETLDGQEQHTLAWVLDSTKTAMGARQLKRWVHQPMRNRTTLKQRQDQIEALRQGWCFESTRDVLNDIGDMERILGRVALRSAPAAGSDASTRQPQVPAGPDWHLARQRWSTAS